MLWPSRTRNALKNDMSSCPNDGPAITLRPTVPKLARWGRCQGPSTWPFAVNGTLVVLNQPNWSGFETEKSPTRSGRHQTVSRSYLQSRWDGETGFTDFQLQVPFTCHPPTSRSTAFGP